MKNDVELMIICLRELLDDVLNREVTGDEARHALNVTYYMILQIEDLFDRLPANLNDQIRNAFGQIEKLEEDNP